MKLSVVIVNWNTGKLLVECLESVYAGLHASEGIEVFLVDNASSDGSAQEAMSCFPQIKLIQNNANPGFANANNQAIARASGEFVLLLNPDTLVLPGALSTLLAMLETCPSVGAVGPKLLNPDGSLQYSCSPEPTLQQEFRRLFHLSGIRPDGYYPMEEWDANPRPTDVLLGACILTRRSALEQLGGFDPRYFMYSEEVDLCRKIRRAGWEIFWVPQAQVIHYGGQNTRLAAAKMFVELYRSKVLYFRHNHGYASARLYKLILLAAGLARLASGGLAFFQSSARRRQSLTLTRNYFRLLIELPIL